MRRLRHSSRFPSRLPSRLPNRLPYPPPARLLPRRSFFVTVPVPVSVRTRTVRLQQPRLKIEMFRNRKLPLIPTREKFVMRRIKVIAPRRVNRVPAARWTAYPNRGYVTVHSRRSNLRVIPPEYNRLRTEERKERRAKGRHGQVESMRSDRGGMLAAAVLRGLSPPMIADTALVSRALYGD